VPIAHCAIYALEKRAKLTKPQRSILEMSKQQPKAQRLQIMLGHTIMPLTATLLSLIKSNVVLKQERHWKRDIPNRLPM